MEPELQRTEEEPKGRSSLTEPEEWSPEAKHGQRQTQRTREPGRASGLMGYGREEGARSHGGATGSTGRGGVGNQRYF